VGAYRWTLGLCNPNFYKQSLAAPRLHTRCSVLDILESRGILGPGDGANINGPGCSGVKTIKESESFPLIRLHGVGLKRVCRGGGIGWKEITAGATCQKARD
jgi:hypothetical protein